MKRVPYDIYWSPEGRVIARVTAASEFSAKRKAPQPYRRHLGELYAVPVTNAYVGKVTLAGGYANFLLGGVRQVESSPFANRIDAVNWVEQCMEINSGRNGCENDTYKTSIIEVYDPNPLIV